MKFLSTVFISAALLSTAAAADPVGQYAVQGSNPGNQSPYRGTVSVERTGDTFRVNWVVGGQRYVGTGIGDDNFIAVSYRSGNDTGLALYKAEGANWSGVWTYANGTRIGSENWTRR